MKTIAIKCTFYSGKLWHSDKPFNKGCSYESKIYCGGADCIHEGCGFLRDWLSTAYEVVNPEKLPDCVLGPNGPRRWNGGCQEDFMDGEEITLPDGYDVVRGGYHESKTNLTRFATITLPEIQSSVDDILKKVENNNPGVLIIKTDNWNTADEFQRSIESKIRQYREQFPTRPIHLFGIVIPPLSSESQIKTDNSAQGDSFENHPLNFVAGPKPKPSREERHKSLAQKIQQAKKEKITESFTRLEMEKMFCMGMLNQRSESIVDLLSEQLPEAQSKMDKIIEEIKNRRVEPSESQEERKHHGFCVSGPNHCNMNYCNENGCVERKRVLTAPEVDKGDQYEMLREIIENYQECKFNHESEDTFYKAELEKFTIIRK